MVDRNPKTRWIRKNKQPGLGALSPSLKTEATPAPTLNDKKAGSINIGVLDKPELKLKNFESLPLYVDEQAQAQADAAEYVLNTIFDVTRPLTQTNDKVEEISRQSKLRSRIRNSLSPGIRNSLIQKIISAKRMTDTELFTSAAASFASPSMRKTATEGARAFLKALQSGNERAILELIARAGGEATAAKPAGLRSHALPPGAPVTVPPSRKHAADMTPEELEATRKKWRDRKAKKATASLT